MDFIGLRNLQKQNRYCEKVYKLLKIYENERNDTKEKLYTIDQTIKLDKMYFKLLESDYKNCR